MDVGKQKCTWITVKENTEMNDNPKPVTYVRSKSNPSFWYLLLFSDTCEVHKYR